MGKLTLVYLHWIFYPGSLYPVNFTGLLYLGNFNQVTLPSLLYQGNFSQVSLHWITLATIGVPWVKLGYVNKPWVITNVNLNLGKFLRKYLPWINLPKVF